MGVRRVALCLVATACAASSDVSSDLAALEARVDALEAENATLAADLAALDAAALRADDLEPYALDSALDDYALLTDLDDYALLTDLDDYALLTDLGDYALKDETPLYLHSGFTLTVPGSFDTLEDALDHLDDYRLGPAANVTIQLGAGTHTVTGTLVLDHLDQERIDIRGDHTAPATVILDFGGATSFIVAEGRIATLAGMTLVGNDGISTYGLEARFGSVAYLSNVVLEDFYAGVIAREGALVHAYQVVATSNTDSGFFASGGHIVTVQCTSSDNFVGFRARDGGMIKTLGASVSGNDTDAVPDAVDVVTGWNVGFF